MAYSPLCRFTPSMIRPLALSPPGLFTLWLVRPLADSPTHLGRFAPWLVRPLADSTSHRSKPRGRIVQGVWANQPGGKQARRQMSQGVKEPGGESSRGQNGKGAKKPDTVTNNVNSTIIAAQSKNQCYK